jgi:hypothetical protein
MPVTPNIIQTAKQTVKAHVLTSSTAAFPLLDIRASRPELVGHRELCVPTMVPFLRTWQRQKLTQATNSRAILASLPDHYIDRQIRE